MGEKTFRGLGKRMQADTIRVCNGRYSEPIFRKTIRKFLNGSHLGKLSWQIIYIWNLSFFSKEKTVLLESCLTRIAQRDQGFFFLFNRLILIAATSVFLQHPGISFPLQGLLTLSKSCKQFHSPTAIT